MPWPEPQSCGTCGRPKPMEPTPDDGPVHIFHTKDLTFEYSYYPLSCAKASVAVESVGARPRG